MRLFVAIHPDASTKEWIAVSQKRLRKELGRFQNDFRWIIPDNAHVTLAFLGEIADPAPVAQALALCQCREMNLRTASLGVFPNIRRPSVFHACVDDSGGNLARLQEEIVLALAPFVKPERRRFVPHLTLARIRPGAHPRLATTIQSIMEKWDMPQQSWSLQEFTLMRSSLDSAGAKYAVLRVYRSLG